ncbi:MAG TPA: hypothetical protein VF596_03835 [Pyrinomonadaceae bacterium]|jgi:Tol biopolymer transport system component
MLKKILLLLLASLTLFFNSQTAFAHYKLVSSNLSETNSGNSYSVNPFQSSDGRYVVFRSNATNLLPNSNSPYGQIYVRDLETGNLELVSVNYSQTGASNYHSWIGRISADGRHVVFLSAATDLVKSTSGIRQSDSQYRIFVRNLETGTTYLIPPPVFNGTRNGNLLYQNLIVGGPLISSNGRFVVYNIEILKSRVRFPNTSNLTSQKGSLESRVYVWDRETGQSKLVSTNLPLRFDVNIYSNFKAMTPDGRFIVFSNSSSELSPVTSPFVGLFVRDMITGEIEPIDVRASNFKEEFSVGFVHYATTKISDDGQYVVFQHLSKNLTNIPDNNNVMDIFIHDRIAKTTRLVSSNYLQTASADNESELFSMSSNGRFVVFRSKAKDLIQNQPTQHNEDVFVWDALTGSKLCVSRDIPNLGTEPNSYFEADISEDGVYVAIGAQRKPEFIGLSEVFVFNTFNNQTRMISNFSKSPTVGSAGILSISQNGSKLVFQTTSSLLPNDDNNGYSDIYSYSLDKGF